MFQHLFHRHPKAPQPRFAQGLFLALIAAFVIILNDRPVVALSGLGTTLLIAAALVELNRERIWLDYKKVYKKKKDLWSRLSEPTTTYYTINTVILWPFIAVLGVVCLYSAYIYTT